MNEATYENLVQTLLEEAPELRSAYESEASWWKNEAPGPHIIFGDVLVPRIVSALEDSGDRSQEFLRRVFDLLERLAKQSDPRVPEVVQMTVCEYLGKRRDWVIKAQPFMGPATRRLSDDIEKFWSDRLRETD